MVGICTRQLKYVIQKNWVQPLKKAEKKDVCVPYVEGNVMLIIRIIVLYVRRP